MSEKIISRNTSKINSDTRTVSEGVSIAKKLVENLNTQGVANPTIDDLIEGTNRYFKKPNQETVKRWVQELLVKNVKEPNVQGIPIDKEKLIDMVQLKGDLEPLTRLLQSSHRIFEDNRLIKTCITVGESGEVTISPKANDFIETRNTRKATNPHQVKVLELVLQLIGTINSIEQLADKRGVAIDKSFDSPLHQLPYIEVENGDVLTPNPDYITMY